MAIESVDFPTNNANALPSEQGNEIKKNINVWREANPSAKIISIETLLVRDLYLRAPYDGEKVFQVVRVWYEV